MGTKSRFDAGERLPSRYHNGMAQALQSAAWMAYNQGYHAEDASSYRAVGADLYRRVVCERIKGLYARGDEQNRRLELERRVEPS
ncbi:MAG TPA: hypothetical protein VFB34_10935 [Chloroflexota bacterium]|nr:hypothetical protein [Chloroflexota bacterium]